MKWLEKLALANDLWLNVVLEHSDTCHIFECVEYIVLILTS
jgi:hypothetical protein